MIPSADDMSNAAKGYLQILLRENLIDRSSVASLERSLQLVRGKGKSWSFAISPSNPIKFISIFDQYLNHHIYPVVYLNTEVDCGFGGKVRPPFKKLVVTVEVKRLSDAKIIYRAHFDLANQTGNPPAYQDGPLYHLQLGGHSPGSDRRTDFRLKIPRWSHPPMDLILVCESIVANFYPNAWNKLKDQRAWTEYVHQSQQLCYTRYFEKVSDALSVGRSILSEMWAGEWGKI